MLPGSGALIWYGIVFIFWAKDMEIASHSGTGQVAVRSDIRTSSTGFQRLALLAVCLVSTMGWLYLLWRTAAMVVANAL